MCVRELGRGELDGFSGPVWLRRIGRLGVVERISEK